MNAIAAWLLLLALGEELTSQGGPLITLFHLLVSQLFFTWFWTHGGQTLGMKVWRIKVVNSAGEAISLRSATIRFWSALLSWLLLGTGFLWSLFNRERQCMHDLISESVLVQVTPNKD
jgi:uncharacterized RDD family membrane protein YckC